MIKHYKKALLIGGSTGTGRAIALQLIAQGIETTVVARGITKLQTLQTEAPAISIIAEDAAKDSVATELLNTVKPDLLILCGGHAQTMAPFFKQSWETFSASWNVDTRIAYNFMSAAITLPMQAGSTIVSFSSGASLSGSRLSGGYAGAKRMQHFLTEYAEREAELRHLNLRFLSVIPKQLIADTKLGHAAGESYAAATGKTFSDFMGQWEHPLTPDKISHYLWQMLQQNKVADNRSFVITGTGLSPA